MIFAPLFWVFVGTFIFTLYLTRKKSNEPKGFKTIPGPRGYPFFGNAFQLGKNQHLVINKWTKKYGDIYKFKLGSAVNVVVSNPKWAKELFGAAAFSGRPLFEGFSLYENQPQQLGLVNSNGELWEAHRRFLLKNLRDFGFGKSQMETLILEEANEILSYFKKLEGTPIHDMKKVFNLSVINSLWSVISQQRFKHDDPKLIGLLSNTEKILGDLLESGGIIIFLILPVLAKIFPELSGYNKVRKILVENREWFEEQVKAHKETFQEDNIRDFIDCYISEMKKTTDPTSPFYGDLADRQLVSILSDLFFAGSDTTSTTLSFAILYLCKFPETQRKFQEEITKITNNSRNVGIADMSNMPYALAMIDEVLRLSSIVPEGVQHRALEGKEFQGYFIPKDAWILLNMHHIHHDENLWDEPLLFKPERFLSSDGKKYQKSENLLPFQIGRRQCVGELLARQTIFLFLANIFQRFEIKFDPNEPEPTLEPNAKFLLYPYPYSVIMKDRQ